MIVIEVSKVLEVTGGILLFISVLYIMVGLYRIGFCTAVVSGTFCLVASWSVIVVAGWAQIGVQIWASVVVFSKSLTQSTLIALL